MKKYPQKLALVVPCYNEEAVLNVAIPKMKALLGRMLSLQLISDYALVLVDDGSKDTTWAIIEAAHEKDVRLKGLKLATNVGHQKALLAGLVHAKELADMVISIDCDLQDDIEAIPKMVEKCYEGFDVVYGVRNSRETDSFFKRNTALAFYHLMDILGVKMVYNHADFRLMSKRAVEHLASFREQNLFLRGLVPLVGYQSAEVYYDRHERAAGTSKYPFRKMLNFAIDGITSFSVKPVRLVFTLGLVFILIAIAILIYAIVSYLSGRVVEGWTSLILSIWSVGGCVLIGLGVIGEYIGKIYIEVKDRPRFNVEKFLNE